MEAQAWFRSHCVYQEDRKDNSKILRCLQLRLNKTFAKEHKRTPAVRAIPSVWRRQKQLKASLGCMYQHNTHMGWAWLPWIPQLRNSHCHETRGFRGIPCVKVLFYISRYFLTHKTSFRNFLVKTLLTYCLKENSWFLSDWLMNSLWKWKCNTNKINMSIWYWSVGGYT